MQRYSDSVTDRQGNAVAGASVTVRTAADTLAALYADDGAALVNPLTTDRNGGYAFRAANGEYSLTIAARQFDAVTRPGVQLFDPADDARPQQAAAAAVDALYVDTVAALRALPAPTKKCVVNLAGYYTAGDGGGGTLLWVPASTKGDNGGTVFAPSSNPANGRWERGWLDVPAASFGLSSASSGTTNANALAAAIASLSITEGNFSGIGARTITLPAGSWPFTGNVSVPSWVNLIGPGKGVCSLVMQTAGSGLTFPGENRGGKSGGFTLDGNDVATTPMKLEVAVERQFSDMTVCRAAAVAPASGIYTGAVMLDGAQNCLFTGFDVQHNAGCGLVFDLGAGNNRFFGSEINRSGQWNIVYQQRGASPTGAFSLPTSNSIYASVIERLGYSPSGWNPDAALGAIYHSAGRYNLIDRCDIACGGLTVAKSMVKVEKLGAQPSIAFIFRNCSYSGTIGTTTVFDLGPGATISVEGHQLYENHAVIFSVDDTAYVFGSDTSYQGSIGSVFVAKGVKSKNELMGRPLDYSMLGRGNSGDVLFGVRLLSETYNRLELRAEGIIKGGTGAAGLDRNIFPASGAGVPGWAFTKDGTNTLYSKFGGVHVYWTDAAPTIGAADGSFCFVSDGSIYVRVSGAWVKKI